MFGQLASSHTVTRRFSRSLALSFWTALPDGIRTRLHDGLRSTGASAHCTGPRAILSPAPCFAPPPRPPAGLATPPTGTDPPRQSAIAPASRALGATRAPAPPPRPPHPP